MRRRAAVVGTIALLTLMLAACDETASTDTEVELTEFSISGPGTVPAGPTQIEAYNVGEFTHTLVITDANGEVAAASDLIQPGETIFLDIDLEPGMYSFTCRIVAQDYEGNLIDHYEAGMNKTVQVEG